MGVSISFAEWSKEPAVAADGECYLHRGGQWLPADHRTFTFDARKMTEEQFRKRFPHLEPSPIEARLR